MGVIVTHESQHIDLLASAAGQFNSLTYRLPTIGYAGSQRKASFVKYCVASLLDDGASCWLTSNSNSTRSNRFFRLDDDPRPTNLYLCFFTKVGGDWANDLKSTNIR